MPYNSAPVPPACLTDEIIRAIVRQLRIDPDDEITPFEHDILLEALPALLEELLAHRAIAAALPCIDLSAASNVVRLSDNRPGAPDPRGGIA